MTEVEWDFTPTWVYGVMVYDHGLEGWYHGVKGKCFYPEDGYRVFHGDFPVTIWNPEAPNLGRGLTVTPSQMETCFQLSRFVLGVLLFERG
jgi:hypothetical protein